MPPEVKGRAERSRSEPAAATRAARKTAKKPTAKKAAAKKPTAKKTTAKKAAAGKPPSERASTPTAARTVEEAPRPAREDALGRAITIRRIEIGLSRRALAARAELSYPYVSELERGAKVPSSAALYALAAALDLTPGALLDRAEALRGGEEPAVDPRRRVPRPASVTGGARAAQRPGAPRGATTAPGRTGDAGPPDTAAALAEVVRSIVRDELAREPLGRGRSVRAGTAGLGVDRVGTLDPATGGETAAVAPGVDAATPGITEEELRAGVLTATRAILGDDELEYDEEGDLPIRRGDVMLFIRVLDDPLSVLIFSPVLVGVGESLLLLERLNALNANMHFVRFCFTHGGVVVDLELPADHFSRPLLEAALLAISQAAEGVGPELQQDVGGRLFFSDEAVPPSRRATAGYL